MASPDQTTTGPPFNYNGGGTTGAWLASSPGVIVFYSSGASDPCPVDASPAGKARARKPAHASPDIPARPARTIAAHARPDRPGALKARQLDRFNMWGKR